MRLIGLHFFFSFLILFLYSKLILCLYKPFAFLKTFLINFNFNFLPFFYKILAILFHFNSILPPPPKKKLKKVVHFNWRQKWVKIEWMGCNWYGRRRMKLALHSVIHKSAAAPPTFLQNRFSTFSPSAAAQSLGANKILWHFATIFFFCFVSARGARLIRRRWTDDQSARCSEKMCRKKFTKKKKECFLISFSICKMQ